MNKEDAEKWALIEIPEKGTYNEREKYIEKFGAGRMAQDLWHSCEFTYGIEYGIKIAFAKIYGDLD